jgi:hypothetical protein
MGWNYPTFNLCLPAVISSIELSYSFESAKSFQDTTKFPWVYKSSFKTPFEYTGKLYTEQIRRIDEATRWCVEKNGYQYCVRVISTYLK